MRLVDLVRQETGLDYANIMLLRHSNARVKKLLKLGGRIAEDYTFVQPTGSEYDFFAHHALAVAVIVDGRLYDIYRVLGVEEEGSSYKLGSEALRDLQIHYKQPERPARQFKMEAIDSVGKGQIVRGWAAPVKATQRYHPDASKLFWKIEVQVSGKPQVHAEALKSDAEIAAAARANRLRFGNISTSDRKALRKQRVGQAAVRKCCLELYGGQCAICDITDEGLLRASHIKGWAECENSRGNLSNVICLCGSHDALFENGYWSLTDGLELVVRPDIPSKTIRQLLHPQTKFRGPTGYSPGREFIQHHRSKHGLRAS